MSNESECFHGLEWWLCGSCNPDGSFLRGGLVVLPPPPKAESTQVLPVDSQERKAVPLAAGCLFYFPAALAEVARVSKRGNDKHNPGEPLHHARGKSMDHADCIARHLIDSGSIDIEDGLRHSAKLAWRALALLQEELEATGAPLARGARLPEKG